jgi:RNA polymerase sigma factor (sigma-70 family)
MSPRDNRVETGPAGQLGQPAPAGNVDAVFHAHLRVFAANPWDPNASRVVLTRAHAVVYEECLRRLGGDQATAADVTQEVLSRVLRSTRLPLLAESPDAFFAYARKAAINGCHDVGRQAQRSREVAVEAADAIPDATDQTGNVPSFRSTAELLARLQAEGAPLPSEDLRLLEGLMEGIERADLARELGVPVGTLNVRLHRLRLRMRKFLANNELLEF